MDNNRYIKYYTERRDQGFDPVEAFGIVASGIAVGGTLEDLQELDQHFQNDLFNKSYSSVMRRKANAV